MSSFLEKLREGMDVRETPKKSAEETSLAPSPARKPAKKNQPAKKKGKAKKIKIEMKPVEKKTASVSAPAPEIKEEKWFEEEGQLTVDVFQTEKEIVIQSAVAGVTPEDIDISIENDLVSIKGKRERLAEKSETNYFYQECHWGSFSREIILPAEVDPSRVQAIMNQGILTIRIPKIAEKEKKRKISVETV